MLHCFIAFFEAILGRLPAISGLLKHSFQRHTRGLVSEFDVFSGDPNLVAASARLFSGIETKLILLGPPLADALVAHGSDGERAVSLEDLAPMRFIRQLHPWEFRLNLRTSELLEFLLSRSVSLECNCTKHRDHCCSHLVFRHHFHRGPYDDDRCNPEGINPASCLFQRQVAQWRPDAIGT